MEDSMAIQSFQTEQNSLLNSEAILRRLDAIMSELQSLRQAILVTHQNAPDSIVDRLWGSLGQGATDELEVYQRDIYVEMFDNG
jgi:hypothetical protein